MITATRCRRLEVWSALQCAGGRRLGIWASVIAAATSGLLGLNSTLTAQVPLDEEASGLLAQWSVVRVWESDTAWDEWVVTTATRDDTTAVLTFTAAWPHVLLGKADPVREQTSDGRVFLQVDRVGQTPAVLIDTLVIAPLVSQGITWVSRGDVIPAAVKDVTLSASSPLQALDLIAAPDAELQFRRVGVGGYAIDLRNRVGADAPVLDLRAARNLLSFRQDSELSEHATVVTAQGTDIDGQAGTIAEAAWQVAAVSGTLVTLADPTGGTGPIAFDAQLDGFALQLPSGALAPIVGSTFATQQVQCATAPTVSVGALVRVVAADGSDLTALPCPPAVREFGRIAGTLERPDLPGHRNLIPNSVLRAWSGAGSTPPDGWATVGSVTLSRLTSGPQIRRGVSALQVAATASGAGVSTPSAAIATTAERPFLSGYVTVWVLSGQVRVELVATTAMGTKVYPLGGNLATSSEVNVPTDLGLGGIDAFAAGITSAVLRVVQHNTAPATFIVESAQLTSGAAQLPFVEGSGANLLWQAVNSALEVKAVPRLKTSVTLLDLARLDPVRFREDCTLTVGGTVRVVHPKRGIDGTARIVQVDRNLLRPGDGAIVLSDKPQDLSGSLARVTWRPRPRPAAPIVVLAGDVNATTAFDGDGALSILVTGPEGADSLRAAVSISGMPSATAVDAATGTLRVDGVDTAVLTAAGPFTAGQLVYIAVRAYRGGVGTRVLPLTDAADAADAAQGPSLEVRYVTTDDEVEVRYAAIGTVTYRVDDVLTAVPSSPFVVARREIFDPAFNGVLYVTRNGLTIFETLVVPPIGVDTVTPDIEVEAVSAGNLRDTVAYKVRGFERSGRGLTLTRTMLLTGCSAIGFSGAGPHTLAQDQQVQIIKPLAANGGTARFAVVTSEGGRVEQVVQIAQRDLTGVGVEVLSNPEFRSDLPRRAVPYGTLQTLAYAAVAGENTSGQELVITKASGVSSAPGSGGFALALPRATGASFVADAYRSNALYLVTLKCSIPVGYTIAWASNAIGTGATVDWLSDQAGTGAYREYVVRVQIGATGSFADTGYFWISNGTGDTAAVTWRCCRINWRDLTASERQPVVGITATIISSDATSVTVVVTLSPATADSVVYLSTYTDANTGGASIGVGVANGSAWVFPRRAFRSGNGSATFGGRTPGFEPASVSLVIPEQGRDTVPLGLNVQKVGGDADSIVLRAFPTDPFPQGVGTLTLSIQLGGSPGASPAGPIALTSGSPVDIDVSKPAENDEAAVVGFTLTNANRLTAFKEFVIEPVRRRVPGRIEVLPPGQSGADYVLRFRGYRADGTEAVIATDVAVRVLRTPAGGTPVELNPGVTRDTTNNWFTSTVTRLAGQGYAGRLILEPTNTARTEETVPIPTWQEPASGMSDAFSSVSLTADLATNTFIPSFSLAAGLSGVIVTASIKRTWGGINTNVSGVEGTLDYTGVVSGVGLDNGPYDFSAFGGSSTTTYTAQLALNAFLGSTLVGSAFAGVVFYVDNTGT